MALTYVTLHRSTELSLSSGALSNIGCLGVVRDTSL